ncbi:MAG: DUF6228 family protein [Gemmatimonadaceae bacterium]|jgi:hypothetical protein|nr:DUF6228 family protein [Gemmatimonadaceae bacterium]
MFEVISHREDATVRLRVLTGDYLLAELVANDLAASVRVGTFMSHGIAQLFDDMAASWRGWSGAKTWRSLEGELSLSAEMDKAGHVEITAELQAGAPAVWSTSLRLYIEAGQLERLAQHARAFEAQVFGAA